MLNAGKLARNMANLTRATPRRLHTVQSTPWIYTNPDTPQAPATNNPSHTTCTRGVCHSRKPRNQQKPDPIPPNDEVPTSEEISAKSTSPSRPPDRWLYKHMLATSRRWWTEFIERDLVVPSKSSDCADQDGEASRKKSLDHAKKVAATDLDVIQKKLTNMYQIIRTKSEPVLRATRKTGVQLQAKLVGVVLKLEKTPPGQKMSASVRNFMQQSCAASNERAKYLEQIQSLKSGASGCSTAAKPEPKESCAAPPPPKGSCEA